MLKVTKDSNRVQVETGTVIFEWDMRRGGQLTRVDFKGYHGNRRVLRTGEPAPNLTLDLNGRRVSLADRPAQASFGLHTADRVVFSTKARLGGVFTVEQKYEVFEEGALFCEFGVFLDQGRKARVRNAEMKFTLDVGSARNIRANYMSREPYLKQDVTCVHVLSTTGVCIDRQKKININHLLSLLGLDLGWDESRYFSNRFEMIIEDSTSFGGNMLLPTRTVAGEQKNGDYHVSWKLCENSSKELVGPFLYRNKWGLFCGTARTESGAQADPARRNNAMGSRICHMMYPYVREGSDWPWCSIPLRQVFYQDVQISKGNPAISRVDEGGRLGANYLILHQFWMRNGGSNGEPMADYKVFDPKWFKATIARARRYGMRVGVYMRGIEHYSLYSDFFEKYLKRNWDGLYIDWATPFGFGYTKSSNKHSSIYNYFMFTRALRNRVGPRGFLIGHTVMQTHASYATFDATLTGEFSVMHAGLLTNPEISAAYAGLSSCGVHLIAGNAPDRQVFSSQRSAGFGAGLGYSHHPFLEPNKPFKNCNAYVQPLWDMFSALGSEPVRQFNPSVGTEHFALWSNEALHPLAYRAANGKTLIMVTNLSEKPVSGSVLIDLPAMGLKWSAPMKPLKIKGAPQATIEGNRIIVKNLQPYAFCGQLV
jgi:hypothetical protein